MIDLNEFTLISTTGPVPEADMNMLDRRDWPVERCLFVAANTASLGLKPFGYCTGEGDDEPPQRFVFNPDTKFFTRLDEIIHKHIAVALLVTGDTHRVLITRERPPADENDTKFFRTYTVYATSEAAVMDLVLRLDQELC